MIDRGCLQTDFFKIGIGVLGDTIMNYVGIPELCRYTEGPV